MKSGKINKRNIRVMKISQSGSTASSRRLVLADEMFFHAARTAGLEFKVSSGAGTFFFHPSHSENEQITIFFIQI